MIEGEGSLIRVLPACLKDPLPRGWDAQLKGYVIETMPAVEHPAAVPLSLRTTEPDILLIDGDFPNLDLTAITREARQAHSGVAVIVLATDHSQERLHQAMIAGVEELLPKPLRATDLHETLLAVAGRRNLRPAVAASETNDAPTKQGRVVGVVSGKGGLGKTTIATNLAALMAKSKQSTGLVGLESGDGAVLLDVQPKLGLYDMIVALKKRDGGTEETNFSAEWMKQYAKAHSSGLQYLTWKGNSSLGSLEVPDNFMSAFIESCRNSLAYTFIDFPILAEEEFSALLPLLDVVLVVSSTSDLLAVRATKNLMDLVEPAYKRRIRILINRADPADMIKIADFEEVLGYRAAASIPNLPQIAAQAINMGAPVATTQHKTELAISFANLANQLFKLPEQQAEPRPAKRFGLF